ncbi:MAG: antibiotic biosynthesis monooxygenase [Corynebacteriales bacterium]|nr:antibiotic biosynthesis monooxygenase [Mycobacteriales bacterium]
MIVITHFDARDPRFLDRARDALSALAKQNGFIDGQLGRAADDPHSWALVTRWVNVGAYRRALGAFEVKIAATPLLADARGDVSAFETLISATPSELIESPSQRTDDACNSRADRED